MYFSMYHISAVTPNVNTSNEYPTLQLESTAGFLEATRKNIQLCCEVFMRYSNKCKSADKYNFMDC